ncbi:MAG: ISL3 family transposase, partial [Roseiflexaceae bacterium]|nr:ISL3 family transposase [Roseiflexaceae bacterium]
MVASLFTSLFFGLTVFDIHITSQTLIISAHASATRATCPRCGQAASSVHSSYTRSPRDLPVSEYAVRLVLQIRRFRCSNQACPAVTFAERLGDYLRPYAQRTTRLRDTLQQLGLALGGAPGERASKRLHMSSSRHTLLRLVRLVPASPVAAPRVLGVDDFALRKGQTYGTILLDLEQRCPIDLLPERSAAVLEIWLKQHPGAEIIARDRGPEYIRGATAGAPDAIQVADRFHLLCNLREALERMLERAHTNLRSRLATTQLVQNVPLASPVPLRRRKRTGTEGKL